MAQVSRGELIRMMVGRELSAVFPKTQVTPGEVVLEARGLSCRGSGVRDVSFVVKAGEILGLAGLVGAGRTELARVIFGLTPADSGELLLRGRAVSIDSPRRAVALGIGYVPEDRRRHGVILEMPVAANTTLATLESVSRLGMLDFALERATAARLVEQLGIKTPSLETPAGNLSGGNQQKVALARWLAARPAVLILDEPTQGVDVGAKAEIHRKMSELAALGMAIVMISSELPEILGMSDRIAVMHGGAIKGVLEKATATQESILELALCARRALGSTIMIARFRRELSVALALVLLLLLLAVAAPRFFGPDQLRACDRQQRAGAGRRGRDDARDPLPADRHLDRIDLQRLRGRGGAFGPSAVSDRRGRIGNAAGGRCDGSDQRRAGCAAGFAVDRGDAGHDGDLAGIAAIRCARASSFATCRRGFSGSDRDKKPVNGSSLPSRSRCSPHSPGDCGTWLHSDLFTQQAPIPRQRGWRASARGESFSGSL